MEIETKKSTYEMIPCLSLLVNREIKEDFQNLTGYPYNEGDLIDFLRMEPDDTEINANLSSLRAIALEVTQACNFRCQYCVYSGNYRFTRLHGEKKMAWETAAGTIDFFLELLQDKHRLKKEKRFDIGFYGGEPLLCFDLIKKAIDYTKKTASASGLDKVFDIDFRITTNGFLLTEEIADFLKENDVYVNVSLDGPQAEHDKFRVHKSGRETYRVIIDNVTRVLEKYPEYYKNRFNYLSTVHPCHDQDEIEKFFRGNTGLFDFDKLRFNRVNIDQLKKKNIQGLTKENIYKTGTLDILNISRKDMVDKFKLRHIHAVKRFTGTCFPGGEKVFIDAMGRFHICEKMNPYHAIGSIDKGFDFKKIRTILRQYNEEIIRNRCWECTIWFSCPVCFANVAKKGKIKIACEDKKKNYLDLIRFYLNNREKEQDEKQGHSFKNVTDYIDYL